jgi:hypothetical protein
MISNSENHPFWFFGGKKIRIETISVHVIFETLKNRQFFMNEWAALVICFFKTFEIYGYISELGVLIF